jgi:hypothetical protein
MHRRKGLDVDVLEQPQHGQFALLVDERIVGQDREVEEQLSSPGSK